MPNEDVIKSVAQVAGAHLMAIGVSMTDVEGGFKIASLAVAIGYGLWRWRTDYKKEQRNDIKSNR